MAANKVIQVSVALTTTTTTNILNTPAIASAGVWSPAGAAQAGNTYMLVRAIRIINKLAASAQAALWKGATGANAAATEWVFPGVAAAGALTRGVVIAGQNYVERFGVWRLDVADFIVGGTDTATALTIEFEAEIGVL